MNNVAYFARVYLSNGEFAMVDTADLMLVAGLSWSLNGSGYVNAALKGTGRTVFMHRLIIGAKRGEEVDHINGDKLDNRRSNLRLCSRSFNLHNRPRVARNARSKFVGVVWSTARHGWTARCGRKYLGIARGPEGEIAMAKLRDLAALRKWGIHARLNFPLEADGPVSGGGATCLA